MKNIVLIGAASLISACATETMMASDFEPTPGGFQFSSTTNRFTQHDNAEAEARRIERLEQILRQSSICQNGYEIEDRQVVFVAGLVFEIFYDGRCL